MYYTKVEMTSGSGLPNNTPLRKATEVFKKCNHIKTIYEESQNLGVNAI